MEPKQRFSACRSADSWRSVGALAVAVALASWGCATPQGQPRVGEPRISQEQAIEAQKTALAPTEKIYKRKVAIGRFSNESRYGRGLLVDANLDPLGKQASDVLSSQLTQTGRFLVFERPDLSKIEAEQARAGAGEMVGVDALILGSVTEFGRSTEGEVGFLSSTKVQKVRAAVTLRLVEVTTGRVFHSADGVGEATSESAEVAGFGSRAAYDSTLNERAISAAVSAVLNDLVQKLEARKWKTFVLTMEDGLVFIAGGAAQGISVGDALRVEKRGRTIKSPQTGLPLELPGTEVARLRVVSQFGDDEVNEGSACEVFSGVVSPPFDALVVLDDKEG